MAWHGNNLLTGQEKTAAKFEAYKRILIIDKPLPRYLWPIDKHFREMFLKLSNPLAELFVRAAFRGDKQQNSRSRHSKLQRIGVSCRQQSLVISEYATLTLSGKHLDAPIKTIRRFIS